jgi:hypothetical protein
MPKVKDLTAPIDLLSLASLDLLPAMAQVLVNRDALSAKIEAAEAERMATSKYLSYCSNSSPENPAMFATLIADGQAKMQALEAEERKLRAEVLNLDQAVAEARVQTRRDILPELRRLGLPAIEGRIAQLEAIAMVDRLLMGKKSQARTVRQRQDGEELTYLRQVRAMLTTAADRA